MKYVLLVGLLWIAVIVLVQLLERFVHPENE
jgi:hypothetical protein